MLGNYTVSTVCSCCYKVAARLMTCESTLVCAVAGTAVSDLGQVTSSRVESALRSRRR
jgi:hypothetical protein